MLSLAPVDRQKRRGQVRDLTRRLRQDGFKWEAAWTTEVNPNRHDLRHVHLLQKGDYVPQRHLQRRWGSIAHIQAVDYGKAGGVSSYILKDAAGGIRAAGYSLKDAEEGALASAGERVRPINITRGFFDGKTLGAMRHEVQSLMHGERFSLGSWVRVPRCA